MNTEQRGISKDDGLATLKLALYSLIQEGLSVEEIIEEANLVFSSLLKSNDISLFSVSSLGIVKQKHISKMGKFIFDTMRGLASYEEKSVGLTPSDSKLLGLFLDNPGKLISHNAIVDYMYEDNQYDIDPAEIARPLISRLRAKLANFPEGEYWIETIRGKGYVFDVNKIGE